MPALDITGHGRRKCLRYRDGAHDRLGRAGWRFAQAERRASCADRGARHSGALPDLG